MISKKELLRKKSENLKNCVKKLWNLKIELKQNTKIEEKKLINVAIGNVPFQIW